jgi:hypothetical protein
MFGSEQLVAYIIREWQEQCYTYIVHPKFSPGLGEIDGKMISPWNLGLIPKGDRNDSQYNLRSSDDSKRT